MLPDRDLEVLRSIVGFVRHRDRVLGEWGFGSLDGRAGGLVALFSGESGTGKTMAAQVIANDLGLEAYRDRSRRRGVEVHRRDREATSTASSTSPSTPTRCSSSTRPTRCSASARRCRDARDRYANLEVAYLLQRVETYTGVVILTTNLRQDVDQAFLRRIDYAIDFPMPGPAERARLWRRNLPAGAPVAADVDLDRLAGAHPLPGGAIRNCARAAAFAAAGDGASVITAEHIERAVARELRKLGRLSVGSS